MKSPPMFLVHSLSAISRKGALRNANKRKRNGSESKVGPVEVGAPLLEQEVQGYTI